MKKKKEKTILNEFAFVLNERIGVACDVFAYSDHIDITPKFDVIPRSVFLKVLSFTTLYDFVFYVTVFNSNPLIRLYR